MSSPIRAKLSNAEVQVYALLAQGNTNKEIAKKLFNSERTIDAHTHRIFTKLGFYNRYEAIVYWWQEKVRNRLRQKGMSEADIDEVCDFVGDE